MTTILQCYEPKLSQDERNPKLSQDERNPKVQEYLQEPGSGQAA